MMFNKKKQINANTTVEKLIVGVFEIRLSQEKIEIETKDKTWKQVYANPTRPFLELSNLMTQRYKHEMAKEVEQEKNVSDLIFNLLYALYGTTLFFYYPSLCKTFIVLCNEVTAKMKEEVDAVMAESDTKVEESNTKEARDE